MATVITGEKAIRFFGLLALRGALTLEVRGMRRSGRPASVVARELLGSRTRSKAALLVELEEHIARERPKFMDP